MATYVFNGQEIEAPDDLPVDQVVQLVTGSQGTQPGVATAQPTAQTPAENPHKIDPETLQYDPDWLDASRIVYERNNNKKWEGSTKDLAEYGLDQMGWFNYNLPTMAVDAARIARADAEHKRAFLTLMNKYDDLEISWDGFGRFIKAVATDPTTYVGLSTFGIGTAGVQGAKIASKSALREMLKLGIQTGIEGAIYGATGNALEQSVRINAGERQEFDVGENLGAAGLGAAGGFALGAAGKGVAEGVSKLRGKAAEAAPKAAGTTLADEAGKAAPEAPNATPEPESRMVLAANEGAAVEMKFPWQEFGKAEAPHVIANDNAGKSANPIIKGAEQNAVDSGQRYVPRTQADISEAAKPATDVILNAKLEEIANLVEEARRTAVKGEVDTNLKGAFADATETLLRQFAEEQDPAKRQAIYDKLKVVRDADLSLSSLTGTDLANRNGKLNTGAFREISPDSLLEKKGIDPVFATEEQRLDALNEFHELLTNHIEVLQKNDEVARLKALEQAAYVEGDVGKAVAYSKERQALIDKIIELEPDAERKAMLDMANKAMKGANEYIISTVFTPKTLMANTIPSVIKTLTRPAIDFVVRGMDGKAFRQMTAAYTALVAHQDAALRAAIAAFKYESGILSGPHMQDMNRMLEQAPILKRAYAGGILRIFPRLLGMTDEYFQQLNYRSYVAASAAAQAHEYGVALGLKGKDLSEFVSRKAAEAVEHAFEEAPNVPKVIDFLRQQGVSNGLSGPKLDAYIQRELQKNGDLFREATSQAGVDFANDMAFKRAFSGEGRWGTSRLAKDYEDLVNRYPIMRLAGQLFFRTPVRVFEEGFRLTAGLNLVTPGFFHDLRGAGGPAKQLRAQGELLLSQAIAGAILVAYANGKISGGGDGDWKQIRSMQGGKWEPYTIYFSDGSKFSFRNYDPFATPLKIITNALDRYSLLQYRKAQGDNVQKEENEALAYFAIATLSIGQAVRDANLTDGLDQIAQLVQDIRDPENNEDKLLRFLGQKAQLLIPNVISKVQQQSNPVMNDPATVEQFIRAKVNPADPRVPKRYDAMGFEDKLANPLAALTGIDYTTPEMEAAVKDPKRSAIKNELKKLTVATGKAFIAPYDAQKYASIPGLDGWKGIDLRTKYTSDGRETYYDRLQRYTSETGIVDQLYAALVENQGGTLGRPGLPGTRVELAESLLKTARQYAFARLMSEETGILQQSILQKIEEANVKAGYRDVLNMPF